MTSRDAKIQAGAILSALAAVTCGAMLLKLLPSLELKLFAGGAAQLVGIFTGSPVLHVGPRWEIPAAGVPVAVTGTCSATDFFLLVAALISWQLARQGITPWLAILSGVLAALPFAIAINSLRIVAVAQAHHWVIPLLPDAYGPFLHMLVGIAVFLPSLVALNLLLEFYGRRHLAADA